MNSDNLNVITFDKSKRASKPKKTEDETPQFLNQNQQIILNNLLKPDLERLDKKKNKYTKIILNQNN
jgi:hypothetical protein